MGEAGGGRVQASSKCNCIWTLKRSCVKWRWLRGPPPYLVWKLGSSETNERCLCVGKPSSAQFAAVATGGWAPAGTGERAGRLARGAPVAASVLGGPGPRCPLLSGGGEVTHRVATRKGSIQAAKRCVHLRKALLRNLVFNRPPHGPHRWTLWSHSTPHAPSGQDPPLLGVPGGRRFWAGLPAARSAPCRTVAVGQSLCPLLAHCGSQNTCGAPGTVLQADEPAEGMWRGTPEPDDPNTCKTTLNRQHHGQGDQAGL